MKGSKLAKVIDEEYRMKLAYIKNEKQDCLFDELKKCECCKNRDYCVNK